jgi:hypothetical protein
VWDISLIPHFNNLAFLIVPRIVRKDRYVTMSATLQTHMEVLGIMVAEMDKVIIVPRNQSDHLMAHFPPP